MIGDIGRLYVVVNSDLKMSAGKAAAQVAHAVTRLGQTNPQTVVVLQGTSWQLVGLSTYLTSSGFEPQLYIDEGVNEVPAMSMTALAFWTVDDAPAEYMQGFDLFKQKGWF